MKTITRILLESGYTKKDIKRLKSDCELFGYDFESSILSIAKKTFYMAVCYIIFFFILSFFVNLLGNDKSFFWFFAVIIVMYAIPFFSHDARYKLKYIIFYIKYIFV